MTIKPTYFVLVVACTLTGCSQ
ncbi:MAG: hypothetical protein RL180_1594, partial [Pseudomonadota bacterium]